MIQLNHKNSMLLEKVTVDSLENIDFKNKKLINTINPHSYLTAQTDTAFANALNASDILLPDGIGIVWAKQLLNKTKIKKIAGYDLFIFLMADLNKKKGSCFFLGSSEKTLNLIKKRAAKEFPHVTINNYAPPFKKIFTTADSVKMCTLVNKANPDILFVGMTAPKQETWVHTNHKNINTKLICSIGAAFDFYSGVVKRPSLFWRSKGLEWLARFIGDPKRLARRNLISTPKFIVQIFWMKIFRKPLF